MNNIGAVFHPAMTVLNAAREKSGKGEIQFYMERITPSVANVLEAVDEERGSGHLYFGSSGNVGFWEWLYMAYDAPGRTLV